MFMHVVWVFLFFTTLNCQFVLERFSDTCSIWGSTFLRKTWNLTEGSHNIIFNICDDLPDSVCGQHKKLCLKSLSDDSIFIHGETFENGTAGELILTTEDKCKVSIQLTCIDDIIERPRFRKLGKCEFEVLLMTMDCAPTCMIQYRGHLINLRPLQNTYHVQSKDRIFSVAVCGSNQYCNVTGISSCDITDEKAIIPLSSIDNEIFTYREDIHEMKLHGSYTKTGTKGKNLQFEVLLKCNWTLSTPHIIYKHPQLQGKKYSFQMETKDGCVKVPPKCVLEDKLYMYNITNLHKEKGSWHVTNIPGNKTIILNICGLLKPAFLAKDNKCIGSSSQICDISGDDYINMGSFHQDLSVTNDKLLISLTGGDLCGNSTSMQLQTEIELVCSNSTENPRFIKEENCVTYLNWKTPDACPKIIEGKCDNKHLDTHNCTFENVEKSYDLTRLYKKGEKYLVKDKENDKLEYVLNVCGPLFDEDAPCMKDAMVAMKNFSEADIRHKVKSYGGFRNISENANGQLVIETYGGGNCGHNQNITYCRSTVFFECSDKEEGPVLLKKTEITLEFLWRTPDACPNIPKCIFHNPFNGFLVDFKKMKNTELKVSFDNSSTYLFDLCGDDKSKCTHGSHNCTYVPLNKTFIAYGNETYLEVNLNKSCSMSDNQFNKTVFVLVCDKIQYNDHFKLKNIENCVLKFELNTHLACFENDLVIHMDETLNSKTKYEGENVDYRKNNRPQSEKDKNRSADIDVVHEDFPTKLNCSVTNSNTGYQLNLSSLNLNLTSSKCPSIVFDYDKRYVSLVFDSRKKCRQVSSDSKNLQYIVLLACANENHENHEITQQLKNNECNREVMIQRPEACKLLEKTILGPQNLSSGSVAGISIGVVVLLLIIIGLGVFGFLKCKVHYRRSLYNSVPYNKNADL